jgi:spermine/spermidine synthase
VSRPSASLFGSRVRLAAGSFLMLFVELALIRWSAANNIYLAYLTNFVLLASFLGIGVGFLRARAEPRLLTLAPLALALLVAFVLVFPVSLVRLSGDHQLSARFGWPALPEWASLGILFPLVVLTLAGIAHDVARTFARFAPLEAYRLDILGSLAGIAAFSLLSFAQLPPVAWGVIAAGTLAALLGRALRWWHAAALLATVALLANQSLAPNQHWSPYYKIVTKANAAGTSLAVYVNNIPHQTAYPVSVLRAHQPFYFFPYRHIARPALHRVLLIGAGTGNDVAVALAQGAQHVDAVEIDPELQHLGSLYHPDHPYQSPRVAVHVTDGRAFLEQTHARYDLILFALPDSLTLLAGQSNLRLQNYLFTIEAMRAARDHLAPGGVFAMYNYYRPFLVSRYAGELASVYGRPPCVEVGNRLGGRRSVVLTAASSGRTPHCAEFWSGTAPAPATDDWPFPYLAHHTIPPFYLRRLAAIALVSILVIRLAGGPLRGMAPNLDLACMGGAFLLLETKNVVQFALLFGTTWFVNSLVFAGVLVSVLAAIEVTNRVRLPPPAVLYAGLAAALAVAWAVPQASLLRFAPAPRFLLATALAFAPIFLANLIFSQRFRDTESSTAAFGANLLGAMLGGAAEYLALVTGYRFLLVVVGALYALAFVAGRVGARAPVPSLASRRG